MKLFIPISKTNDEERMVYGFASTPDLDSQGEIVSAEAIKSALDGYLKFPTIREMHQAKAVGTTKSATVSKDGMYIGAKIVDKEAWEKVKEGVYRAFSIGGKVTKKVDNVIQDMLLTEISLVDRPANENAVITLFKRDDSLTPYEKHVQEFNQIQKGSTVIHRKATIMSKKEETQEVVTTEPEVVKPGEKDSSNQPAETEVQESAPTVVVDNSDTTSVPSDAPATEEQPEQKEAAATSTMQKLDEIATTLKGEEVEEATEEITEKMVSTEELTKMADVQKAHAAQITQLEAVLEKTVGILGQIAERVSAVEATPAAPKTVTTYAVEKELVHSKDQTAVSKRATEIQGKLKELMAIRDTNLVKFQSDHQTEAYALMDELAALSKQ